MASSEYVEGGSHGTGPGVTWDHGPKDEHYCPDHWIINPNDEDQYVCSCCGRVNPDSAKLLTSKKQQADLMRRTPLDIVLKETYKIEEHEPREPGKDWNGQWQRWASGKGTDVWQSEKRAKSSVEQAKNKPATYRIVKILTRPEIIESLEVVDVIEPEADYNFINDTIENNTPANSTSPVPRLGSDEIEEQWEPRSEKVEDQLTLDRDKAQSE